jgi:hypothetical protein
MSDQTADKVHRTPTSPVVQFVDALPARTRTSTAVRKSKYDAVYEMLKEHPGQWAFIGTGKTLHGSLVAYKKRRDLDDFRIAWRGDSVFAGVNMPDDDGDSASDRDATPAAAGGVESAESAEGDRPATPEEIAASGWPTGSDSPVTAGNSEGEQGDGWA